MRLNDKIERPLKERSCVRVNKYPNGFDTIGAVRHRGCTPSINTADKNANSEKDLKVRTSSHLKILGNFEVQQQHVHECIRCGYEWCRRRIDVVGFTSNNSELMPHSQDKVITMLRVLILCFVTSQLFLVEASPAKFSASCLLGRWYQMYSSLVPRESFQSSGVCNTLDFYDLVTSGSKLSFNATYSQK